jgi:hypothetical protein
MFENLGKTQRQLEDNTIKILGKHREHLGKTQGKPRDKLGKRECFPQVFPKFSPRENPSMSPV